MDRTPKEFFRDLFIGFVIVTLVSIGFVLEKQKNEPVNTNNEVKIISTNDEPIPEYAHGPAPIGCQDRYCPETYDDCVTCGYTPTQCKDLPFCKK
jgi:hypothetical protein